MLPRRRPPFRIGAGGRLRVGACSWPHRPSVVRRAAMSSQLRVRRARRDDFERVRVLLGIAAPAARAERKRFRRLVSTLREDLYLAERGDDLTVVALAVIVYVRGLGDLTAVIRQLRGAADGAALLV